MLDDRSRHEHSTVAFRIASFNFLGMLELAPYREEIARRPKEGRRLLAQHDEQSIVVYQAYRPEIAEYAAAHGHFGGNAFSFSRMSWIKPSFLWMMFRCGWATKPDQERVLAIRMHRAYFDALLARVVPSSWVPVLYPSKEEWTSAVKRSDVRLQWDPDHGPSGAPTERRTIQLGLRDEALAGFRGEAIVSIEDITDLVIREREHRDDSHALRIPIETEYSVTDQIASRLGVS
jgi:hypothetical protein